MPGEIGSYDTDADIFEKPCLLRKEKFQDSWFLPCLANTNSLWLGFG